MPEITEQMKREVLIGTYIFGASLLIIMGLGAKENDD